MKYRVNNWFFESALYPIVDWDYGLVRSPYYELDMGIMVDQKYLIAKAIVPQVTTWTDSAKIVLMNTFRYFLNKYPDQNDKFWQNMWERNERVVELDHDYRSFFLLLFGSLFPDCQPGIQPNEEFVEDENLPTNYVSEVITHFD